MATSYTGLRVQDTYNAIIKIGDNSNLTATPKLLSDGLGNDSPLYLSGTRLGIGISPAYQFHTSGNAKIGGNLIVSGNLTVNGTLTYLNVQDLAVEDPIIKLAKDNTANTLDIGLFGKYVATGTKYKGFFNDASDDKFKLFIGTTVEPTTTVDTSASGYTIGTLVANLEGNVTGTVSSLSNHTTTNLAEGTNLYYTNARADARVNLQTGANLDLSSKDTDDLSEGTTNLYFTTARARASFTEGTGVTITNGEIAIGQDVSTTSNVTFGNITGSAISGTTGTFSGLLKSDTLELTSGADHLTFTESSGDWTINNSQQNNGITIYDSTGGVDINYASSAYLQVDNTGVHTLTNIDFYVDTNLIYADATNNKVGIGVTAPDYKLEVNGQIASNNYIIAGLGNGGVALTHNDGYGNANVTFNHVSGTPEQDGSSGRIVVTTDGTTAKMTFELKDDVTSGVAVDTPQIMELYSSSVVSNVDTKVRATAGGILSLQRNDTTIGNGNHIGSLNFSGDDPTDGTFNPGARIRVQAVSGWSANNYPSKILIQTDNSGTLTTALTIDESQNATFANNVTIPETPTADAHAASKKYVDDNLVPAQSLSNVLGVGNTSGANDIIMADDQKISFGDDSNFSIDYNSVGDFGRISNTSGHLYIQNTADNRDIIFRSDNGSGGVIEYFKLDGSTNTIPFGRSPHIVDNLKLYFGNDTANDASIKWDSTASELFIDGESKFLDNLAVVGAIKDSDGDAGTSGQVLSSTGTGTNWIDVTSDVAKRLEVTVKNVSGGSLAKGVVVHAAPTASPPSGNVIEVIAADANDAAKMPAIGVLNETIADEAEGEAVMFGAVSGIDTSSFSIGDELYVSETAGEFTATKPTAFSSQVQKIAVVIKSHATNGLIKVFGAGRANDVPNRVDRDMNFTDNSKLIFGDDSDLFIVHNDTNGVIENVKGDFVIQNKADDKSIIFRCDNGTGGIIEYFRIDGSTNTVPFGRSPHIVDNVKLYFGNDTANDASIKWDSTASQLFIDGVSKFLSNVYFTGNAYFGDNDKLYFGDLTTPDLEIYHDGSNSYIRELGTGNLYLDTNGTQVIITTNATAKTAATFTNNGSVDLYYNNSKKFETTSTGVTVTGNIDGVGNLFLQDYIYHSGDGDTYFGFPTANEFKLVAGGSNIIAADANSAYLYYQGSVKLQTTSTGVTVTGGGTFTGDVNVGANTNATRKIELSGGRAVYEYDTTKGTSGAIVIQGSANKEIHFETTADTPDMIIDSSGNVGIGTDSPDTKLEIVGNNPILTIRDSDTSSSTATSTIRFAESNASDTLGNYWDVGYSPVNLLNFDFNGSTKITINSSGNVGIGTTSPDSKLDVTGGDITVNTTGTGFMNFKYSGSQKGTIGTDGIDLKITANADLQLLPASNVGINTASPEEKLHVIGSTLISNNEFYKVENTTGTNYKIAGLTNGNEVQIGAIDYTTAGTIFAGGDNISITTGGASGTSRIKIDSTGNVGINNTNPTYKLDVAMTSGNHIARFAHSVSTGYAPASILLQASQSSSRGQGMYYYNTEADENWFVGIPYNVSSKKWVVANKYSTNVEIDTAQLTHALLTVDSDTGNVDITGGGILKGMSHLELLNNGGSDGTATSPRLYSPASGTLAFSGNGSERMRIDSSGNVTIGNSTYGSSLGQLRIINDAASSPASLSLFGYNNVADGGNYASIDLAMQTSGTGGNVVASIKGLAQGTGENASNLAFYTKPASGLIEERMRIDSSGNVGIGLTNQAVKLEIQDSTHTTMKIRSGNNDNILFFQAIQSDNARIGTDTNTDLSFYTNTSERGRIKSSGNLQIYRAGNTNGGTLLLGPHGSGSNKWSYLAGTHYNQDTGSGNGSGSAGVALIGAFSDISSNLVYIGGGPHEINAANAILFFTHTSSTSTLGGSERMRIGSSGNVGMGGTGIYTTVATLNLDGEGIAIKNDRNGSSNNWTYIRNTATGSSSNIQFVTGQGNSLTLNHDRSATFSSDVQAQGLYVGSTNTSYDFYNNGTSYLNGTTTIDATLYITNGKLAVGTPMPQHQVDAYSATSGIFAGRFVYAGTSGSDCAMLLRLAGGSTAPSYVDFIYGSVQTGYITTNGSSTFYGSASDYRLKENVVELNGALDRLDNLQPKRFNFTLTPEQTVDGFLAHEVADVVPEAIHGKKDAVNEDGEIIAQGIDQAKLVPLLVAAVQELRAEVELLKSQINS
jgi:hypothetical protein